LPTIRGCGKISVTQDTTGAKVYFRAIIEMKEIEQDDCGEVLAEDCPDFNRLCRLEIEGIAFDALVKNGTGRETLWEIVGETKVREIVKENVSLIRTIEEERLPLVTRAIVKFFKGKIDRDELVAAIEKDGQVDTTRAEVIANDQVAKASVKFQLIKWEEKGWKRVMWKHARGVKEPREYHIRKWDGHSGKRSGKPNGLNGFIFSMDNPPVIDEKTGERGYPAQLVNCTCYLVPYD